MKALCLTALVMAALMVCGCMTASPYIPQGKGTHPTWTPTPEERGDRPWMPPNADAVVVSPTGVSMPLNRFVIIRRGKEYCALKFTDTWTGETKYDHLSSYESYYQGDGSGDFSKSNIIAVKGELFFPRVKSFMGLPYISGGNNKLTCGSMTFKWEYITSLIIKEDDFAPTPWKAISEVNVFDSQVTWYQYDEKRAGFCVQADDLWGSKR